MKSGANFIERNEIKRRSKDGETTEEISNSMQINLNCVKSFAGEEVEELKEIVNDDELNEFKKPIFDDDGDLIMYDEDGNRLDDDGEIVNDDGTEIE